MATKTYNYSLLQGFVKLFHLPWSVVTVIVAVILLLFLVLVAYFQGYFTNGFDWSFWRFALQPAIIVYILAIYPLIQRLWERALQSLRLLFPETGLIDRISTYNRRWEWMSLFLGCVFALVLSKPWVWSGKWIDLYFFITSMIMFSMLGFLIYGGFTGTIRLAQLNRKHLRLDIFDAGLLVPVAHWSFSVSLAFVGGICISILFQPFENLQNMYSIITYSILLGVTILLFFTSMWSTHSAMASAKKRELAMVRKKLDDVRRELRQHISDSVVDGMDRLYPVVTVWKVYERQVLDSPTWPFNSGILGRLIASAVAPAIIYVIKIFSGLRFS